VSWHTNPALIALRSAARKVGVTRALARLLPNRGYEVAFDDALFAALRPGDVVWDVGANVGYYTRRFAEAVGPHGHVEAFEPFPLSAERLRDNLNDVGNYALTVTALGATSGTVTMRAGGDGVGATNRITDKKEAGDVEIRVETGDSIMAAGMVTLPTVVKIDTEGFELDVLLGMRGLIDNTPTLRALFIEVHFGILAERGMPRAPAEIEAFLREAGFATRWVDSSHIAATRG
jgi:FkbM family methyltransferase